MHFVTSVTHAVLVASLSMAAAPVAAAPTQSNGNGAQSSNNGNNGNGGNANGPTPLPAPTYCAASSVLSVNDVTFSFAGDSGTPPAPANDCYGVVAGNDTGFPFGDHWGGGWTLADKSDSTGPGSALALFGGLFRFEVTAAAGSPGTWALLATDMNGPSANPDFPIYLDFIAVLKGSNRFAMYFFDDVKVDELGGGNWTITYENNGGNIPGLSHLSFLVREGKRPDDECTEPGGCGPQQIPEPGALALAGLALAALGAARRRRPAR